MLDSVVHGDSVNCQLQADFFLTWISNNYIFPHGLLLFGIHNMSPTVFFFAGLVLVFYNKRNELEVLCKASLLAANGFVTDK